MPAQASSERCASRRDPGSLFGAASVSWVEALVPGPLIDAANGARPSSIWRDARKSRWRPVPLRRQALPASLPAGASPSFKAGDCLAAQLHHRRCSKSAVRRDSHEDSFRSNPRKPRRARLAANSSQAHRLHCCGYESACCPGELIYLLRGRAGRFANEITTKKQIFLVNRKETFVPEE